jgi:hypothetical protein
MRLDPLQCREVFHLTFLRGLTGSAPASSFALKGGSNLRFFFGSSRYSEDMDIDVAGIPVHQLMDGVMAILRSPRLCETLRTYGIEEVQPPDPATQKQTETVQRFKVHLITANGIDLFTKVKFSRRGLGAPIRVESIPAPLLARYRMPAIIVPHYGAAAATRQKVSALRGRRTPQARDVFDLFTLLPHIADARREILAPCSATELREARERVFAITYAEYRDQVVEYLAAQDQGALATADAWDEIRLHVLELLERPVVLDG